MAAGGRGSAEPLSPALDRIKLFRLIRWGYFARIAQLFPFHLCTHNYTECSNHGRLTPSSCCYSHTPPPWSPAAPPSNPRTQRCGRSTSHVQSATGAYRNPPPIQGTKGGCRSGAGFGAREALPRRPVKPPLGLLRPQPSCAPDTSSRAPLAFLFSFLCRCFPCFITVCSRSVFDPNRAVGRRNGRY